MIIKLEKPYFPYKIVLNPTDGSRKFTYYSYDCEFLSYDDTRYSVEIYKTKYELPILQKQSSIFS